MPVPLIIRGVALVKEAIDWFGFANEAFSALGLAKRTAVAGAVAAAVATPVVVAKPDKSIADPVVVSAPAAIAETDENAAARRAKIQAARERAEREAPPVGKLPAPWEL